MTGTSHRTRAFTSTWMTPKVLLLPSAGGVGGCWCACGGGRGGGGNSGFLFSVDSARRSEAQPQRFFPETCSLPNSTYASVYQATTNTEMFLWPGLTSFLYLPRISIASPAECEARLVALPIYPISCFYLCHLTQFLALPSAQTWRSRAGWRAVGTTSRRGR